MANLTIPIQVNLPDDWVEQIIDRLRNDPTSDWVDVIRCKDCLHYRQQYDQDDICMYRNMDVDADDFCSQAVERR